MTDLHGPVLLYDGTCGFCAGSVRFVLRHDTRGTLRFASLQSPFGRRAVERHPELRALDSMVWLDESNESRGARLSVRSDAALRVARYLGRWWMLAGLFRVVPRPMRDGVYDLIARHRERLTRGECLVPTAADRHRFLDQ